MKNPDALALVLAYMRGASGGAPQSRLLEADDPSLPTRMVHLWPPTSLSPRAVVEVVTYVHNHVVAADACFADQTEGAEWLAAAGLD